MGAPDVGPVRQHDPRLQAHHHVRDDLDVDVPARLRLFRINIGEPLQRLDVAAKEHLEILDACLAGDPERAVSLLAQHVEISREHTLGLRPMRWNGKPPTLTRR